MDLKEDGTRAFSSLDSIGRYHVMTNRFCIRWYDPRHTKSCGGDLRVGC
jgi:hypothetical protein